MPDSLSAHVVDGTRLRVLVESDQGATLVLVGEIGAVEPEVEDGEVLGRNPALVSNMWAYAKTWESVHLLGAAIGAKSNWDALTAAVDEAVYGYHSSNDKVLKLIYKTVQGGQSAAGCVGFEPASTKLVNVDVSSDVPTHVDYQDNVRLR